ncbi:MAG: Ig-like domain-containing protein [Armatimonadota bacterium]
MSNFNGVSNPEAGYTMYTNNTTVTASGTATAQFIPFWKTGYYQWGRGLSGADTYYKFTTNSGSSWSHTETGVTGYRRFHFFGISRSGRTSGQASGSSGGWTYNNSGNCAWAAVFVDNVAPNNPGFSSVNAVSPTQVNLAWAIPLDKGVGVADGATEDSDSTNGGSCHYRRGDVGVNVRRNGTSAYGWGTATSLNDSGLTPNTQYTYDIAARDNTSQSRGSWANVTSYVSSTSVYTLSPAPVANSVTADKVNPCQGASVVWTNNLGWGAGGVEYFRYAWDKNPTHTWTDTETQWSSGSLSLTPTSSGTWYLHVKSFNAANAANGAFSYSVEATPEFSVGTITGGGGSGCGSIDPGEMTYSGGSGGGTLSYQWYSRLGNDSPTINDTLIAGATSASYDPPTGLTETTTYNVLVTPTCGTAAFTSTPVTVTVNPLPNTPTNPIATPSTIGPGGSSVLSAMVENGEEVVWYKDSCGGTPVTSPVSPTETTTYYAKAKNTATGCLSASCAQVTVTYVPDDEGPELTNVTVTSSDVGEAPTYNFLKGTVTVEAEASDDSGVASVVFVIDDSETPITMTFDPNTGKYVGTCTIDEDWTNGQHSITVIATDIYDNESDDTKTFSVNKNEINGLVGIEDSFVVMNRSVTFVLNGTITKTVSLNFINGKAYYSFTDVPEITTISAKTAWHLRTQCNVTMVKGQAEVNFLGAKVLRGGDLATPGSPMGDNTVNALDYAILRGAWGYGPAGDINGDGVTDNNDYLILMKYLYVRGDLP